MITDIQAARMIEKAAIYGANRALESCAKIKSVIMLSEAYSLSSRKVVDRAINDGHLHTIKKGGKTSKIWISREAFDRWLLKNELYNEPVTPCKETTC